MMPTIKNKETTAESTLLVYWVGLVEETQFFNTGLQITARTGLANNNFQETISKQVTKNKITNKIFFFIFINPF